ncbi:related to multidrug resistance-associated protein [Phialocephala subalpina]|uniref:Related to multidrug resistance-associated protein n=1 Tax=Phialocephala subalpina TaxID=576137 RepID=A0A1L7XW55_9HELO|nr:related to multidrug resistance-associated protein [Phialocephala subalpina]
MDTHPGFSYLEAKSLNSTTYAGDNSFGPFLDLPSKTTFDFTLLFEESILSILPSALFLLLIPLRILRLWKTPRKVTGSYLQTTKIVILAIFSVLQIVNVIEVSQSSLRTRASLAAALLALGAALGLYLLSYFEHTKNIRPSSIIDTYLLLTLPFDAAQVRTRWLRGENIAENGVASALIGVKILVLTSEATEKRGLLFTPYADPSPEATSGLYSRGLFWWLTPLFQLGFRNVVNEDDLFTADGDLLSKSLETRFNRHWANRYKYPKKHTLVWVMLRTMLGPFAAGILPRLALTFFRFMQPLLISSITKLVSEPDPEATTDRGWGLTAAFGLVYIGMAVAGGAYQHKANRMATMVRGSLVNAIYAQTLDLSITSLDESAAVTLMSSDVERICDSLLPVHNIWSGPLEIALAIWLLQKEIGLALLGPLIVTALAISGPFLVSPHMGKAQKAWIQGIQTRIDTTAKMLQAMKGVKMLGLNSKMSNIVRQLRLNEITKSLKMRKLFVIMIAFGNMSDIFAPGAAFTIYVIVATVNGQTLDVTSAFTALSLIALLVAPIRQVVFATPPLLAAVGCSDRIEAFLSSPTKRDHRMLQPAAQSRPSDEIGRDSLTSGRAVGIDIELEDFTQRRNTSPSLATIRVRNLTLGWSDEGSPVIDDVSLDFPAGELTMIVGPVGCGKSSLLRGLLGETPSSKGNVYIDRAYTAFVDQTPWVQNSSVRKNIIGVTNFELEWYAKVVHACALDADIETFPEGDNTKAGSAGTAISGGQKLRIALARAVYSRYKVLMLDDVFSGLDATSEDRIFSRLLGKSGLLRQLGTTVILVTHAAHRLSYADHIIALNAHGMISEQGKLGFLLTNNGYVASLAARHTAESEDTPQDEPAPAKAAAGDDLARQNAAADLNRPVGSWAVYNYYFTSVGRRNVLVWMGGMIIYATLTQFPNLWFKFWTSAVAVHGNSVNGLYLGTLLALEVAAMVTLMTLARMTFVKMIPRSAVYLHGRLLETIENAPLSFFTSTDSGQIVNRFSQDLSVIDMELPLAGLILANNAYNAIIQAIFICISASYFAIVLPFVAFVMYAVQRFYLRTSRQIRLMDLEAKAPLYSNFLETLSGLVTIRAFGWTKDMEKRNMAFLDASQRPFYLLYCIQRWLTLVIDLVVAALGVILVALIVRFRHSTDAGFVGVALISIMSFNQSLTVVIQNWTAVETSLGAISRIKSFVGGTPSENLPQECQEVPPEWPSEGSITVSNISAAYTLDQQSALHDVNLSIPAGQKFGICGPSGSGKSSFVALLFHMLEIKDGSILIDGIDISSIPRRVLRERLTAIPQDPIFLKGTIRQNLDPLDLGNDDSSAEDVLKKVGLWTIVTNAGGLDVPMEAEDLLSHGQRQLFCLARAMLRSSKILVIDEATASVDLQTDELMQQIIAEHFKDCTIIAVAHRLQTIRNFDRITVFGNGRVVEFGEPDVLLADEGRIASDFNIPDSDGERLSTLGVTPDNPAAVTATGASGYNHRPVTVAKDLSG